MDKVDKLRIMNHIRLAFRRADLFKSAFVVSKFVKGPKGGKMYICSYCPDAFLKKDIQIDHIIPIVPLGMNKLDMSLDHYADKIFCGPENLQPLCKDCHHKKTQSERHTRDNTAKPFYV